MVVSCFVVVVMPFVSTDGCFGAGVSFIERTEGQIKCAKQGRSGSSKEGGDAS